MKLPGFSAEATLYQTSRHYRIAIVEPIPSDRVIPQDCGFWKGVGCSIWPIPFCAPAGLGGAAPFVDCVDRLSNGGCVDCVLHGRLDPRASSQTQPHPPPEQDPRLNPSRSGLTIDTNSNLGSQLASLKRQLDRIERCTCGHPSFIPPFIATIPATGSVPWNIPRVLPNIPPFLWGNHTALVSSHSDR